MQSIQRTLILVTFVFGALTVQTALAQFGGGGGGGTDTIGTTGQSGIAIDAEGVLRRKFVPDPNGALTRRRLAEAHAALDKDLARPSKLRKVSINRLEAIVARLAAEGRSPNDAMRHLAGLTEIQYVFYYPQTRDIVIAGPAEGWAEDLTGRMVGINTGRPTLLLEDLVVALRAFPPTGNQAGAIVCSIDPTQEGLVRMQKFLASLGTTFRGQPNRQIEQYIVNGLQKSLGLQNVTIGGVSPNTHFAQVMVEADYRMKLIGIGLERPPVKLVSYVERARPSSISRNAMQRWYFVPDYQCVRVADDRMAMELVGDGVKLIGEDEVVGADGRRSAAGQRNRASDLFVKSFTEAYPKLAAKAPVYAQLRNLIDMAVAAAFMQKEGWYDEAAWKLDFFGDEKKFAVEDRPAPKKAATAVNSLWKGSRLLTPVGGGVRIEAQRALASDVVLRDEKGQVRAARAEVEISDLPADAWWWD